MSKSFEHCLYPPADLELHTLHCTSLGQPPKLREQVVASIPTPLKALHKSTNLVIHPAMLRIETTVTALQIPNPSSPSFSQPVMLFPPPTFEPGPEHQRTDQKHTRQAYKHCNERGGEAQRNRQVLGNGPTAKAEQARTQQQRLPGPSCLSHNSDKAEMLRCTCA